MYFYFKKAGSSFCYSIKYQIFYKIRKKSHEAEEKKKFTGEISLSFSELLIFFFILPFYSFVKLLFRQIRFLYFTSLKVGFCLIFSLCMSFMWACLRVNLGFSADGG